MMETYLLSITLKSDTILGRGEGVAGLVDAEVEHDEYGLPYLRGRALKGLLSEECANILFALRNCDELPSTAYDEWERSAACLFGLPGSTEEAASDLHVGNARLPEDLQKAVRADINAGRYTADEALESLTAIRAQTAMDEKGVPDPGSLRTSRVILRETPLEASVHFAAAPDDGTVALLAACARALRRMGLGRNRGYGRVRAELLDLDGNALAHRSLHSLVEEEVSR